MNSKVLILGADGMLGSACYKTLRLNPSITVIGTTRRNSPGLVRYEVGLDSLESLLTNEYDYVVNCIGVIKQKINPNNQESVSNTWAVNAKLPKEIASLCELQSIKAIQIATDCAFSGSRGNYTENDLLDAEDLYGLSKVSGEIPSSHVLNLRCSIIGREMYGKHSLLEWFLAQEIGADIQGYTNHFWNGVTTLTFASILEGIIANDSFKSGTYHLVPADQTSKFNLLSLFKEQFNRNDLRITPTTDSKMVNRTLKTLYPSYNSELWNNSSCGRILSIEESVALLAQSKN